MQKEPLYVRADDGQNGWNMFFSLVFVGVCAGSVWVMYRAYGVLPNAVPVFDALVMVLAVFRLTRLFVYEKITRFLREWFMDREMIVAADGEKTLAFRAPARGLKRTFHDLLGCPWCVAVWATLPVVFGYYMFSWVWYVLLLLAVSGVATLVQLTANLIGWKAELGKLEAGRMTNKKS